MDAKQDVLSEEKKKFLINEFLTLSINGAFGHAKIYKENVDSAALERFKREFNSFLREQLPAAALNVQDSKDLRERIQHLQTASRKHSDFLEGGNLRIGICQKALNLFLKYKWVAGLGPEPPDCPFDNKVLQKLKKKLGKKFHWTQMDSIDDYDEFVKAAKQVSHGSDMSIAQWELKLWNRTA